MQIELKKIVKQDVAFIEAIAGVRYWEDAKVNGVEDSEGKIPLRVGDVWCPVINLETGEVKDWPVGVTADVHYKVCDAGEYFLQDSNGQRVAKWNTYYVPNDILCVGDSGHGDYIIFKIGEDGFVKGWCEPQLDSEDWDAI